VAGSSGLSATALNVRDIVAQHLPRGTPVVISLSGGADSATLAWAASGHHQTRAVSVDHRLPGSAQLMAAAGAIAERLGIEHVVVPGVAIGDSETELRRARLAALEAATGDAELIATGHTSDDQAETVLGNVLRGSGTSGLSGIPLSRDRFIRPLLGVSRATTRTVAAELELPYVDDPMNDDRSIRRNRLRHTTIPSLIADYNPNLVAALNRLAAHAAADDEVLEERARRVPVRQADGVLYLPAAALATLPHAVAARVARRAMRILGGPHAGTGAEIAAVLGAVEGRRATISSGVSVSREGPWVVLLAAPPPVPEAAEISPGSAVTFGSWHIGSDDAEFSVGRFGTIVHHRAPLMVRAPEPGDTIALGTGSKRVVTALAEARVPGRLRAHWPVVVADETILWIPGVRSAPAVRSGTRTRLYARRLR
jgi:tRNA(Ile)-lysidine synthase